MAIINRRRLLPGKVAVYTQHVCFCICACSSAFRRGTSEGNKRLSIFTATSLLQGLVKIEVVDAGRCLSRAARERERGGRGGGREGERCLTAIMKPHQELPSRRVWALYSHQLHSTVSDAREGCLAWSGHHCPDDVSWSEEYTIILSFAVPHSTSVFY